MLGKTHVASGVATSLVVLHPNSLSGVIGAVIGGAVGGWMCDVDCKTQSQLKSSLHGFVLTAVITCLALYLDHLLDGNIYKSIVSKWELKKITGAILVLLGVVFGITSNHRSFTHSIFALLWFTFSFYLLCEPICAALGIGFISHLILDLPNKKGMQLFFPFKKKVCLNICSSDGKANSIIMIFATILSVALVSWFSINAAASDGLRIELPFHLSLRWYLVIINLISFVVMMIDAFICSHTDWVSDENVLHTYTNLLGLIGGGFGQLLSMIVLRQRIGKHNANWYAIIITFIVCWTVVYSLVYDPFKFGYQGIKRGIENHIPLLVYLIIINLLSAGVFFTDRQSFRNTWNVKELWMFLLGMAGGTVGALLAMYITGSKLHTPHFSFGFPVILAGQMLLISYSLVIGIL